MCSGDQCFRCLSICLQIKSSLFSLPISHHSLLLSDLIFNHVSHMLFPSPNLIDVDADIDDNYRYRYRYE